MSSQPPPRGPFGGTGGDFPPGVWETTPTLVPRGQPPLATAGCPICFRFGHEALGCPVLPRALTYLRDHLLGPRAGQNEASGTPGAPGPSRGRGRREPPSRRNYQRNPQYTLSRAEALKWHREELQRRREAAIRRAWQQRELEELQDMVRRADDSEETREAEIQRPPPREEQPLDLSRREGPEVVTVIKLEPGVEDIKQEPSQSDDQA